MTKEHVHKYVARILGGTKVVKRDGKKYIEKTGGYPIYKCVYCSHYIAREVAIGRECICWKCGEVMTLNAYSITLSRPRHRQMNGKCIVG